MARLLITMLARGYPCCGDLPSPSQAASSPRASAPLSPTAAEAAAEAAAVAAAVEERSSVASGDGGRSDDGDEFEAKVALSPFGPCVMRWRCTLRVGANAVSMSLAVSRRGPLVVLAALICLVCVPCVWQWQVPRIALPHNVAHAPTLQPGAHNYTRVRA